MKVLIIGNSTRSIVCSAKKAGYTVYALDHFGDLDMRRWADKYELFDVLPLDKLHELIESFGKVDAVVLGPGFERLTLKNALNNPLKVMEEVNDKSKIAKKLKSMDIPHPQTRTLNKASELKFPLMIKPKFGSGGMLNMFIKNEEELAFFKERKDAEEFIAQEFVQGIPCSVSLICSGDDAAVVALNEQLIGVAWLTRLPFAYCGNITPFHTKFDNEMIEYAKQISLEFGLYGSNGVDFILTEKGVVVLEINPRFQGSLDTVELSMGINIFDAHVKSFAGKLPKARQPLCFAAKAIVFADKKVVIDQKFSDWLVNCMDTERAADVPMQNTVIKPDEPITTLIERGKKREIVLEKLCKSADYIGSMTEA